MPIDGDTLLRLAGMKLGDRALIGPEMAQLDLTDDCANNCIACWARSPFLKDDDRYDTLEKGTLNIDFVSDLIPQFALQRVKGIFLGGGGDPTCYPRLADVIGRIKAHDLQCAVNTSFACANKEMVDSICDAGLDHMIVSVWAGNPTMYARLHPNKSERSFFEIRDMLTRISRRKTRPKTTIYNVICSLNYREIPEMIEFAREAGADEVEFSIMDPIPHRTSLFNLDAKQIEHIEFMFDKYRPVEGLVVHSELFLRRLHNVDVHKGVFDNGIVASIPCAAGWFYSRVTTTGQTHGCLKAHRVPTGELKSNSFERIWYGEEQNEFRRHTLHINQDDPYLLKIGHDIKFGLPGCYRVCDNIGRNQDIMKMAGGLTPEERALVDRLAEMAKSGASRDELFRVSSGDTGLDNASVRDDSCVVSKTESKTPVAIADGALTVASGIDILHDRIAGRARGFSTMLGVLRNLSDTDRIRIPLIPENIFHLPQTLAFIERETGRTLGNVPVFTPEPLETLGERLSPFLGELTRKLSGANIDIDPATRSLQDLFGKLDSGVFDLEDRKRAFGVAVNKALAGPRTFHLDVCNACNTNCAPCWFHSPYAAGRPDIADFDAAWKKQKIDWDDFTRLIDDLADMTAGEDVVLSGKGEPTMHPRIGEMARYIKKKGMGATLFTNGIGLTEDIAKDCVESECDMVYVSLMSATAENYKAVHTRAPGGEFNAVLKNISGLVRMKKKRGARLPQVVLVNVISALNVGELIPFAKLGAELGVDLLRYQLAAVEPYNRELALTTEQLENVAKDMAVIREIAGRAGIHLIENIDLQLRGENQNWSDDKYLTDGCLAGWTFARIWAGGELSFCCSPKVCGNLKDKSFKNIWYSQKYDRIRIAAKYMSDHRDFAFDNRRSLFDPICMRCPNYEGIEHLRRVMSGLGISRWL